MGLSVNRTLMHKVVRTRHQIIQRQGDGIFKMPPCSLFLFFIHIVFYTPLYLFSAVRAYINDNGQKAIAGIVHCAEKYRVCCSRFQHGSLGRTHAESVNNIRIILYWVGVFQNMALTIALATGSSWHS